MFGSKAEVMDSLRMLLDKEIEIFKCLDFLKILELKGMVKSSIYEDVLGELELLSTKEDRILDNISCSSDLLYKCFSEIVKEIPDKVIEKSQQGLDLSLIGEGVSESALNVEISEVTGRMNHLVELKAIEFNFNSYAIYLSQEDDELSVYLEKQGDIFEQPLENRLDLLHLLDFHDSLIHEKDETKRRSLIEEEFKVIYQSKFLTDELIKIDMKVDLLCDFSDEASALQLMDDLDLSKEEKEEFLDEYKRRKEAKILEIAVSTVEDINEIEAFLAQITDSVLGENEDPDAVTLGELADIADYELDLEQEMSNVEIDNLQISVNFSYLAKLLNLVSTSTLTSYLIQLKITYGETPNDYLKQLIELTDNILLSREDYVKPAEEIFDEEYGDELPEKVIDDYFALIKLSHLIFKEHKELCRLHLAGLYGTKEYDLHLSYLEQYLDFEQATLDKMYFFENTAKVFDNIFENSLDLIITDNMVFDDFGLTSISDEEKLAIKTRLQNLIPMLKELYVDDEASEEVLYSIGLTHNQKVFKAFYNYIESETDLGLRKQLIREMYRQSFYNSCISMDMVGAKFNPNEFVTMDDELSSTLLGVSMREYCYDKDIKLYMDAFLLLDFITEDMNDKARTIFNIISLKELLKSISFESICGLKYRYQDLEIQKGNVDKTLKLMPLFKSVLPDYMEE